VSTGHIRHRKNIATGTEESSKTEPGVKARRAKGLVPYFDFGPLLESDGSVSKLMSIDQSVTQ